MKQMRLIAGLSSLLLLGAAGLATAKPWWMRGTSATETDFLPPDVAFRVGASVAGNLITVRWVVADGYYLYRRKIDIRPESPDLMVSAPQLPQGVTKTDPYLGTQEIYTQQVEAQVPFTRIDAGAHPLQIKVTYQGCAEAGLCYPPITKVLFPAGGPAAGGIAPLRPSTPHAWEGIAILAGGFAFLLAGLVLRKGRKLDSPAV
jgi:thioredoxin:protein disulfide reductase